MCLRYEDFGSPDYVAYLKENMRRESLGQVNLGSVFGPNPNIALTETANIVFHHQFLRFQGARFGLVPSWAKAADARLGNARSETLDQLPSFRELLPRRRCLVAATAFYEWALEPGQKRKTPYRITTDEGRFFMAGLWDYWAPQKLVSFTIITTQPNELVSRLHDRMPVIMPPEHFGDWLDPANSDLAGLKELLQPYPAVSMTYQPYDRYVSSAANKDPNLIVPAGEVVRV